MRVRRGRGRRMREWVIKEEREREQRWFGEVGSGVEWRGGDGARGRRERKEGENG